MTARCLDVADAVVTALNAISAAWGGETFTAERTYAEADSLLADAEAGRLESKS